MIVLTIIIGYRSSLTWPRLKLGILHGVLTNQKVVFLTNNEAIERSFVDYHMLNSFFVFLSFADDSLPHSTIQASNEPKTISNDEPPFVTGE